MTLLRLIFTTTVIMLLSSSVSWSGNISSAENSTVASAQDLAEMHYQKAMSMYESFRTIDDVDNAIIEISRAIDINPDKAIYYKSRGDMYSTKSVQSSAELWVRHEKIYGNKSLNDYAMCVRIKPVDPELRLHCNMYSGVILCDLGRRGEAFRLYDKILSGLPSENKPDQRDIYELRATCYMDIKAHDKAIENYSRAIKLCGDEDARSRTILLIKRASAYYDSKQIHKALYDYEADCSACRKSKENCNESSCESAYNLRREIKRGGNWVRIGSTGEGDEWFYDKTRITVFSDKNVKVWTRTEKVVEMMHGIFPPEDYSYDLSLKHIDCVNQEMGYSSINSYDAQGNFKESWNGSPNKNRTPIVPDSIGDIVREKICDIAKKKSSPKKPKTRSKGGLDKDA